MAKEQVVDYLIVGQGLAGTLLAHFLLNAGVNIKVVDNSHSGAASTVAAGIINPITGRRFVKSWKVDELIPFARETYQELENILGQQLFKERAIIRTLFNNREENDWIARTGESAYQPYMAEAPDLGDYASKTEPAFGYGEVLGGAQVDVAGLVEGFREYLIELESYEAATFDYDQLVVAPDEIRYQGERFGAVVFCEGHRANDNPFFNYLPFGGTKGEVLIVRIPNGQFEKLLKHRVFIVPIGSDQYWIGATYDWKYDKEGPSSEGRAFLQERLEDLLKVPFEIIEHKAAVRPTVKDRRPFLGRHPKLDKMAIFNGLGTKGASLGPFWARHMADFLTKNVKLDPTVAISRFDT